MEKIKRILEFAMRMEKDAATFYEFYMDSAKSEDIKSMFSELVEIEKQHYELLKSKYDALNVSEPPQVISWVIDDSFRAKDPHILADESDTLQAFSGESTDLSIIRTAFLIEHDFEYFYTKAAEAVDELDAKKFLLELADWEKSHSFMFQNRYRTLLEKNWSDIVDLIL